ncbi:unnamed protein product [Caenorhabditis angaria]|uniref:SGNH domain-containing protein n=1 Tax=Caenorhabditis angaria TaxID=860376 RepID=A0A9P1J515_9PELO|nr:unnamed protein product [Caenorhabditis angaria]
MSKLICLQGLRGISIFLVVLFHLFPKHVVQGFVGVDILLMTLLTAAFCYHCSELETSMFVSKPLVFLGDLSYVIYLIHWPIITVIRYTNLKDVESLDFSESIYSSLQPEELQKQIILNTKTEHLIKYVHDLPCIQEDDQTNSIIGQKSCLHLKLYARTSSAPLSNAKPAYTSDSIRVTKQMKPDMLWIIQGMNEIVFSHPSYRARMTDKILDKTTQKVLDKLKSNARIVAIDLPYYISHDNTSNILARKLLYRHEYEQSSTVNAAIVSNQIAGQTQRLLNLKCSNCFFTPVQESIMQHRIDFIKYDLETKAAIIHDGSHLSRFTYRKFLYPSYMEHIRRFYSLF